MQERPEFLDEVVDVVDEDDRVIGRAIREEIPVKGLRHRLACVVVRNSAGQIYVHRRTSIMDVFPDMYDMMVAGHVKAGETYEESALRELTEELGISGAQPRALFKYRYDDPTWPSWATVFDVVWDGPIHHQATEIAWGAFMDEAELVERIEDWTFTPDGVEAFRQYLSGRG
ncbi:MAG: NUDIX domain-containing protein [Actinomycetota bacterium]|nr:NUDIX domain-containing protein [Actinomycetota bacterium]